MFFSWDLWSGVLDTREKNSVKRVLEEYFWGEKLRACFVKLSCSSFGILLLLSCNILIKWLGEISSLYLST